MARNTERGDVNLLVTTDASQAVAEIQRLSRVATQSAQRTQRALSSEAAETYAQNIVSELRQQRQRHEGIIREAHTRGIINPQQAARDGALVGRTYALSLLSEIDRGMRRGTSENILDIYRQALPSKVQTSGAREAQYVTDTLSERYKLLESRLRARVARGELDERGLYQRLAWAQRAVNSMLQREAAKPFADDLTQRMIATRRQEVARMLQQPLAELQQARGVARGRYEPLLEAEQLRKRGAMPGAMYERIKADAERVQQQAKETQRELRRNIRETIRSFRAEEAEMVRSAARDPSRDLTFARAYMDANATQRKADRLPTPQMRAAQQHVDRLRTQFDAQMAQLNADRIMRNLDDKSFYDRGVRIFDQFNQGLFRGMDELRQRHGGKLSAEAEAVLNKALMDPTQWRKRARGAMDSLTMETQEFINRRQEILSESRGIINMLRSSGRLTMTGAARRHRSATSTYNEALSRRMTDLLQSGQPAEKVARSLSMLANSMKSVDKAGGSFGQVLNMMRRRIFDLLAVYAAINFISRALGNLVGAFVRFIQMGSEVSSFDGITKGFTMTAARIGALASEALPKLRESTRGTLHDMELLRSANLAIYLGAVQNEDQLADLAYASRVLGRAMGIDASRSMEDLTIALGRQSTRVLDNLGIYLRLEEAQERYAVSLGKTRAELTAQERQDAFAVIGLEMAVQRAQQLEAFVRSPAERMERLTTATQNWSNELKSALMSLPSVQSAADQIRSLFEDDDGVLDDLISGLTTVVGLMARWAEKSIEVGGVVRQISLHTWGIATRTMNPTMARTGAEYREGHRFVDVEGRLLTPPTNFWTRRVMRPGDDVDTWTNPNNWFGINRRRMENYERALRWENQVRITPWLSMDRDELLAALLANPEEPRGDPEEALKGSSDRVRQLLALYRQWSIEGRDVTGILREIAVEQERITQVVRDEEPKGFTALYISGQLELSAISDALNEVPIQVFSEGISRLVTDFNRAKEAGENMLPSLRGLLTLRENIEQRMGDGPVTRFTQGLAGNLSQVSSIITQLTDEWVKAQKPLIQLMTPDGPISFGSVTRFNEARDTVRQAYEELEVLRTRMSQGERAAQLKELEYRAQELRRSGMNELAVERWVSIERRRIRLQTEQQMADEIREIRERNAATLIRLQQGEVQARIYEIERQAEHMRREGASQADVEAWMQEQRRAALLDTASTIEQQVQRMADVFTNAMSNMIQQADTLSDALRQVASAMALSLGSAALSQGARSIGATIAQRSADKATESGMTDIGGALMTRLGLTGLTGGVAMLGLGVGLSMVGSLFGRSPKEREDEVYRANLRALRDARDDGVFVTLVLPTGIIDTTNPVWKEAVAETLDELRGTRMISGYSFGGSR